LFHFSYSVTGFSESAVKLVASLRLQSWGLVYEEKIIIFRLCKTVAECCSWFFKRYFRGQENMKRNKRKVYIIFENERLF